MPESELFFRRASVAGEGDVLRATLATEDPVEVYDFARREVVKEILVLRGAEWPEKLRMVEDHTDTAGSTVGTVKEIERTGDAVQGVANFAGTEQGRKYETLYREGHLEDVSIGGQRKQVKYLARGEQFSLHGKTYMGPARLVTRWKPIHLGLVGTGADPKSKMSLAQRAYVDPYGVQRQMEAEHTTTVPADHQVSVEVRNGESTATTVTREAAPPKENQLTRDTVEKIVTERLNAAAEAEIARIKTVSDDFLGITRGLGFDDEEVKDKVLEFARSGADVQKVSSHFYREKKQRQPLSIYGVESADDKYRAASYDGFLMRAHKAGSAPLPADFKPADGHKDFAHKPMKELARDLLYRSGELKPGMTDKDIFRHSFDLARASDGPAYHSTGSFSNLLLDAFNKVLLSTWENTPSTYQDWIRIAEPLPDFKNRNVVRMSEVGNIPMVPEGQDYKDASLSDQREVYFAQKHGSIVSLTWETWVNDDLNAFSRIVSLQGAAAKRSVNKSVYQLLFDNPTMRDTGAVFNSTVVTTAGGHANLVNSALDVSALNTAYTTFATRTGINSDVILGLSPQYLIVSAGYFNTAWQIVASPADPTAGGSAVGSSGVLNLYGPSGARPLQIVMEPLIDGNDATSWYLAADPMVIDTIELAFLAGEETPVFDQETGFINDTIKYKVRQSWGVSATEWRGLYKSTS